MRTKKLFSMKKFSRFMALGLAGVLVLGSLNVMNVQAAPGDIIYPKYDQASGEYKYNPADIFGAATHVHLFGHEVTTSAHTHGNVMAEVADLSEIGMRDGKVAYPEEYIEYSYIGDTAKLPGITIHNPIIIGDDMEYDKASGVAQGTVTNKPGSNPATTSAHTVYDGIFFKDGVDAVNVDGTLTYLKGLSKTWSLKPNDTVATVDVVSDQNNRIIDAAQGGRENTTVFINIPLAHWEASANYIQIKGIDSNVANQGYVVINIDLAGQTDVDLSCGDMKVSDLNQDTYNNTEHTSAAFGSCRIVYNLYDSSATDRVYTGNVKFMGTVFGNILAPGANVTMGALNGNVMAHTIHHIGQESHRMDIVPIFSKEGGAAAVEKIEKDEIRLLLELKDQSTTPAEDGVSSETTYTLYEDEACTTPVANISAITAVWNKEAGKYQIIISSQEVTEKLGLNEDYFLKKTDVNDEYTDNNTKYEVFIDGSGTVKYREIKDGSTPADRAHEVLTDVLEKKPDTSNDEVQLKVELDGPGADEVGADSGVKYDIYVDPECKNPVAGSTVEATYNDSEGLWEVTFDKDITDALEKDTVYYVSISDNGSDFVDKEDGSFKIKFDTNGDTYYLDESTNIWVPDVPTDVLIKNGDVELKVELEGEETPGSTSDVTYEIYEDEEGKKPVSNTKTEATYNEEKDTYEIVIDSSITSNLDRDKEYYINISKNDSDYVDKEEGSFKVKFDSDGNTLYFDEESGSWTPNVPTDILIKGQGNTPSDPSEDPSEEDSTSEGTSEEDSTSEETSEEDSTSEGTSEEDSTSEGTSEEDSTGEGTSEEDSTSEGTSEEDSTGGKPSTGTSEQTPSDPGISGGTSTGVTPNPNPSTPSSGSTNTPGTPNKGDGSNSTTTETSGETTSTTVSSADTGEVNTIVIFAGFVAVIALAAGVYVFIKRKRA